MASKQDFLDVIQYMESRGNPNAVSPAGASGTMQTMPATRETPGFGVMPVRDSSIEEGDRVGRDYALALLNHYGNDPSLALAAYNAGPGNVNKYRGVPPFAETQKYVKEGLNYLQGDIDTPEEDDIAEFEKFYAETNPTEKAPDDITQFEDWYARQQPQQELPERTAGEYASDVGTSVEKGILGAGQAVVGLGDLAGMPFGVSPGKYLEEHGYDMAHNQDILSEQYSPQQKEANKRLAEAHGITENIKAAWGNPSAVGEMLMGSAPAMIAGGMVGRASKVLGIASPYVAAGLGEGAIAAGQIAEQLREQAPDKELTGKGALASIGAGVGTGVLGGVGSKLITKIGGIDANLWLSGGAKEIAEQSMGEVAKTPGFFKKALVSAFGEGVLEEAPQSAQEQMWQNYATDKPLLEGVEDAAVKGAILGSVMGGGASTTHSTLGGAEEEGDLKGKYSPERWEQHIKDVEARRAEQAANPPAFESKKEAYDFITATPGYSTQTNRPVKNEDGTWTIGSTKKGISEPIVRSTEEPAMAATLRSWGLTDKNKLYKDLVNVDPDTPEGYKRITKAVEQTASKYTSKGTPLLTASFNHKAFADFKDQQEAKLAEQVANPPEAVEEEPVQKPTAEEQKPTAEEPVQEQPVAEVNAPSTPLPESAPAEVIPTPVKRAVKVKTPKEAPAEPTEFNSKQGANQYIKKTEGLDLETHEAVKQDNGKWKIEELPPIESVAELPVVTEAKKQPAPKAETSKAETPVVEEKPEPTLEDRFEPTDVNLSHIKQFEPGKGLLKEIRSEKGLTIKEVKEKLKTQYRDDFLTGLAELSKEKPVMNIATAWTSPKRAPVVEEEEAPKKPLEFSDADRTDYKKRIAEGTLNESETAQAIHSKLKTRNYNLYKKYNAVHENAVSDKEQAIKTAQRAAAKNKPKVEAVKKERVRATVQETAKKLEEEANLAKEQEQPAEDVLTEQGEDRYSVASSARDTGHTIESLSKSLSPELKRLVKSGKVVLHNTANTLPGKNHPANVQGMTTKEGVSHYVANKLNPHSLHKVALHEVGVHVGMEKMVGAKVWIDIKQQVLTNKGRAFDEARAAVPAGTAENLRAEEALAYLVENSPALPLVRQLISAIRNWARTALGMNINLTENDARHLAERALRKESKIAQKTTNTTDIKYSLSDPDLNARLAEMEADIKKAVAPEASGFRRKLGRIATYMQSDDAWFQMQSAKQLRRLGMPHKMAQDLLLAISKAQAVHYTSVAGAGIEMGALKFNDDLKMFEGVFNDNNLRSLTSKLTALGAKYNKTADEMKDIYQNVMVARRVKEIRDNALEILKTADKLSPKLKNQFLSKSHNKSALELAEKIHSITDEQVEKDLNLIKDYPELEAKDGPIKMWDNIRKNAIKTLVDTGYWTEEKATNYINNAAYVPFNRDMSTEEIDIFAEDMQSKPMFGGKGLTRHAKEHKIKGSTREVLPIIENMESWLATAYSKAIKNHKAVQMVDFTFDYMPEGSIVKLADSANKDGAFYIFRKGIKEWYKMEDPLAAAAFIGMPASANGFVKIAAPYARKLRNIIVLNPLFTLAQLPQDTFSAMYTSGLKNPFALPLEVTKEFVKTLAGKSKAHATLKPRGVVGTLDYSDMAVRRDLEASMGLSEGPKTWKDKMMRPLEHFAMIGDNSVRQAVYNRTKKEMGDSPLAERIAVERAFEIVNFRRRGASAGVDAWRQVVPFFGAYLQVQSVALKTLSGTGITPTQRNQALKTLAFTSAQVMAMSFLYNALAGGDDEYDKMDPAVRDKKLFVFGADKPFTIPLRQDIFLMPHIVMTHVYDSLLKDVEHPDVARKVIAEALWNSVSGVPTLPTMIRAPLENLTNYDFNTGRPIEGVHLKNIATAYKANPSTSETAKMLGKIEDAILPEKAQISPIKIDHMIQGFFGTAAGVMLQATDSALRTGMDIPSTDMSWQDAFRKGPGVSAFIASEKGSRDQAQFYRFKEEVDKAYSTLKSMDTKPKEQEEYYAKHAKLIDANSAMQAIEQRLSAIRKEQKANADMPNSYRSPKEKMKYKEMLENEIDTTVSGIRQIMNAAYRK